MYKYLKIPPYYSDLNNNIYSKSLQIALKEEDLLTYLRNTFQSNISLFYNIRDEMLLRGIVFKKEYQNNFFPDLPYEIKNVINIDEDVKNFKNIDNQVTGIHAIINRYQIDSDYFFINMPIEGIAHYLKKDAIFLEKQFERVGFSILPIEKYHAIDIEVRSARKHQPPDEKEKQSDVEIILTGHEKKNTSTLAEDDLPIRECFNGRKYLAFHSYCFEHGINFFSELTIDFIEKFQHVKGVGVARYTDVLEIVEEISIENGIEMAKLSIPLIETKKVTPIEYFGTNPLKSVLEQKGVDYLTFVDSIYYAKEEGDYYKSISQDVFDKKSIYVQTLIEELDEEKKEQEFKTLEEKIKNHPNYELLKGLKKKNIMSIFRLSFLDDKEENIHLFEMVEKKEYKRDLMLIKTSIEKYRPPSVKIKSIETKLTDREWQILIERLDKTLQEVGGILGVTRERVRQIESKANKKIQRIAKNLHLDILLTYFLQKNLSMTINEFMEKLNINQNYKDIFLVLVDSDQNLERKDEVLINKKIYAYTVKIQNIIDKQNEMIIDAKEVMEKFNENNEFEFTVEMLDYFMQEIDYKRKNAIYFKNKIKLPAKIAYLFKNDIREPLELTDENFEYMQTLMENLFDDQFESGKRAAIERIRSARNVILVEANTFMYYDLDDVSQELLDEIEAALKARLNNESMVTADMLFHDHLEKWNKFNLLSHYHLYSILQFHFNDMYVIGKGNTLTIYKSESAKEPTENILINYLKKNGGVVSKKQITESLKWQSYKLEQVISKSTELVTVVEEGIDGYAVKLITTFGFREGELEKIKQFVKDFVTEDYFFTADLLFELEFEDEYSVILARTNITDTYTFGSILKFLNPDLRGFQHLLYKKESEIDSIEKVLIKTFPNLVRRDEIEDFLKGKGYAFSTISHVINLLLENKSFYIYTMYQYINAKQIYFTNEVKDSLKQYLQKSFGDKMFYSALDFKGYTSDILAVSKNDWKPQLIAEFASRVGYVNIRTSSDYRYNKWILIREELGVTNYEELIHYVVTNYYEGNYHEQDLAKFLESKKLAHSPYQLGLELKTSKYFQMKDLGFVEVKERQYGVK